MHGGPAGRTCVWDPAGHAAAPAPSPASLPFDGAAPPRRKAPRGTGREAPRGSRAGHTVKAACAFTEEEKRPGQANREAGPASGGPWTGALALCTPRSLHPAPPTPLTPWGRRAKSCLADCPQTHSAARGSASVTSIGMSSASQPGETLLPGQRFLTVTAEVAMQQVGGREAARHPVEPRAALTREGAQPDLQSRARESPRPPPRQRPGRTPPCRWLQARAEVLLAGLGSEVALWGSRQK